MIVGTAGAPAGIGRYMYRGHHVGIQVAVPSKRVKWRQFKLPHAGIAIPNSINNYLTVAIFESAKGAA